MKTTNTKNLLAILNNSESKNQSMLTDAIIGEKEFKQQAPSFSAGQLWSIHRNRRVPAIRRLTCI